jgi:uncharacterized Zn-binding protein involved in type VI secretion
MSSKQDHSDRCGGYVEDQIHGADPITSGAGLPLVSLGELPVAPQNRPGGCHHRPQRNRGILESLHINQGKPATTGHSWPQAMKG